MGEAHLGRPVSSRHGRFSPLNGWRGVFLLVVFFALASGSLANATIVAPLSEDALIEDAVAIVIGDVTSIQGNYDRRRATIFTNVTVAIEEVLRGEVSIAEIMLRQPGGSFGDLHSWLVGSPHFTLGEKVLLFLRLDREGTLRVAHLYQGKFTVSQDSLSGEEYAIREAPIGVRALGKSMQATSQNPQTADTYRLHDLTDRIRNRVARSASPNTQWRQPLTIAPQESADTTLGSVRSEFTFMGPARWFEPDTNGPVAMEINSTGEPLAPTKGFDQVRQAFQAWSGVTGSSFRYQDGGFTDAVGFQYDGINAVSFGDPLGDMDPPVNCSGTLAVGGFYYTSQQTRTINGTTFYRIVEGDLVFNEGWAGCGFYENFANFAEVATHELGHVLGLDHSTDPNATMYYMAHFDGRGAALRQDDIDGLGAIYPGFPITVTPAGSGSGSVTSVPSGIDCGATCSANFSTGTSAILTATAGAGSTFAVWTVDGGACPAISNAGLSCTVSMTRDHAVTATFQLTSVPPAAILVAPSGTVSTTTPAYSWAAVPTAEQYYLQVTQGGVETVGAWYTAAQAGCGSGTGTCSVTPGTALAPGTAAWRVRTWNSAGYGPYSGTWTFRVGTSAPPPAAILVAPSGTVSTTTPAYSWAAVPTAEQYYLQVTQGGVETVGAWYTAAQAGCGSGTGTCSVTPGTALAPGTAAWRVRTWNSAGYGPYSGTWTFRVGTSAPPPAAILVAPSGTVSTTTPAYSWAAVPTAEQYYLQVTQGGVETVGAWYTAAQAGCGSGTGTCSVTPGTALAPGTAAWRVRTWNSAGYGPYSGTWTFRVGVGP